MMQWIKKLVICMCCFCMMGLPVNVMASKKFEKETDVDELQYDEDQYADVTFKGKINGESDQKYFYITAVNLKTAERYTFNLSTRQNLVVRGKLPLGDYQIQEGGVENDWTGEYYPNEVKFSINDRSAAKIVNVTFGAERDDTSKKNDDQKSIFQTKPKKIKQSDVSNGIRKTDANSDRKFYIFFAIGIIACGGLIGFIIRFIKKFR